MPTFEIVGDLIEIAAGDEMPADPIDLAPGQYLGLKGTQPFL